MRMSAGSKSTPLRRLDGGPWVSRPTSTGPLTPRRLSRPRDGVYAKRCVTSRELRCSTKKNWTTRKRGRTMKSPLRSHGRRPPVVAAAMMALLLTWGCEGDTVVSPTTVGSPDESPLDSSIHVSGTGTATAMPDLVEAYIGVQTFAATADAAVDNNSTLMTAVINALTVSGIAPDDIETTNFSVRPQRDYSSDEEPKVVGFWVDNTARVTIRDISGVGSILTVAVTAGANNIGGVTFTVSDADSLRQAARADAVSDARNRAQTLADAAGVELGEVLSITELSGFLPIKVRAEFDAEVTSVPVQSGELSVTAQVQVVFKIR
ncbi:MAG TPA: SIMPL domain-containing protein [Candidatus Latescibacteria bacterium]|nr:SIMPL domain-containing protein [Candidatus Latescibacterota bacterium]